MSIHPELDDFIHLRGDAHGFSLLPKQPVQSLLSGRHASRLRGRGLLFEELRDYRPGDDIRLMDWRATARLKQPHVRVYSEERERPVLLVVDQRINMFFGSRRATKATTAGELAALAAWKTFASGDRVGALIITDQEPVLIKPQRSRNNVLRICNALVDANRQLSNRPRGRPEALNEALAQTANLAHHDFLVTLITDFHGDDDETTRHATRLAAHNDVLGVLIYDPLGARLPEPLNLPISDGAADIDLKTDAKFVDRFEQCFKERRDLLCARLRALRIPVLPICTHDPVMDQILAAFGQRS